MFRFLTNSCWIFRGHSLNICVAAFLPDLNFLFSLALLNRAGTVQTFKKYGGFIKGTDSEQKLFEIFFEIFNIFQPGGGWSNVSGRAFMWIFVLYSPSALLWFSSKNTWYCIRMVIHENTWIWIFEKVSLSFPTKGWTRWLNQLA